VRTFGVVGWRNIWQYHAPALAEENSQPSLRLAASAASRNSAARFWRHHLALNESKALSGSQRSLSGAGMKAQ
jgi:hypothetical protein